jgi:hypothetical protein
MTGYFIRIERNGKWQAVEIDQMSGEELELFFRRNEPSAKKWAIVLAEWIRDNVNVDKSCSWHERNG